MIFLCKFLFRNLKQYRLLVVLAILVACAQVGSDLAAAMPLKFIPSKVNNPGSDPTCTFPFLDGVLSYFDTPLLDPSLKPLPTDPPGTVVLPPPAPCPAMSNNVNSVVNPTITQHSVIGVIVFSLLMLAVFGLISAGLVYVELYLATFIAQNLSARLREELFDHLQRLSLDWHDKQKKGDLVQRVTGNIADIEKLVTDGLVDLLAGILTLIGVAVVMVFISVQYTILSLAIAPLLFLIVGGYTGGIKAAARKKAWAAGKMADVATEDINALTVIRAFNLETRENKRFGGHVDTHRHAGMRAGRLQAQFTPMVAVLVVIGTMLVVGIGGYVAAGNAVNLGFMTLEASTIDVGTLILFLTYLKMLYQPMRDLSKLTNLASNAVSGAERIQEVLGQAPEIIETDIPYDGPQKLRGEITFEDVHFGYLKGQPVLKGIDLHIPASRRVALVGYSGSGKTTLAKLVPRFYELLEGSIKIDGRDTRDYPLHVLRQNISMVLQDSVLFEGTIRDNIDIGRPDSTLEEVIEAAKKANIHDFIMSLPYGYDTVVREQGNNFSGGQRQRLAIARAILRDTPILILDEPTANLDVESEAEVMRAISSLIVGRTVITISHRLSTLGHVDEILVMNDGQVAQKGTFRELKYQEGIFAELLEEQNRYNLDRSEEETVVRSAHAPRVRDTEQLYLATTPLPAIKITPVSVPVASLNGASANGTAVAESMVLTQEVPDSSIDNDSGSDTGDIAHIGGDSGGGDGGGDNDGQLGGIGVGVWEVDAAVNDDDYLGPTVIVPRVRLRKASIRVEIDGKAVKEYALKKPRMTVGRLPTSDIPITSQRVSRFHALIHWRNGAWVIEDAESLNGLSCEGRRIDEMELADGRVVHIDSSILLRYIEAA